MKNELPSWAQALEDDPRLRKLSKPSNEASNWVHANPGGRRLRTDYFVDDSMAALVAVAVFGEETEGQPGYAHGGAIVSLMDDVLGTTAWLTGQHVVSLNISVDFRLYVPIGVPVRVSAEVSRVDGRKVYAVCKILSPPDTLHAEAEGLFLQLHE